MELAWEVVYGCPAVLLCVAVAVIMTLIRLWRARGGALRLDVHGNQDDGSHASADR
jgi:hypothetical protein